jgi:GNAT superfamily N-acetyltransferase
MSSSSGSQGGESSDREWHRDSVLRAATLEDLPALPAIEHAAGELFRLVGMDLVADDEDPRPEELRPYVEDGRAWVWQDGDDVVAYLVVDVVDGCAHIEQVSVHPDHGRRRIGAALLEHTAVWALARGLPALTLTTFRDVAWNGPYYLARGFRWLDDDELTPGLRERRRREIEHGLDRWPRGCMRRDLGAEGER